MDWDWLNLWVPLWTVAGGIAAAVWYDYKGRDPASGLLVGGVLAGALAAGALQWLPLPALSALLVPLLGLGVSGALLPRLGPVPRRFGWSASAQRTAQDAAVWQTLFLIIAGEFLLAFTVQQWGGVLALWRMLRDAVLSVPAFITDIADYFASVPGAPLIESLLAGAVFGGVTTLLAVVIVRRPDGVAALTTRSSLAVIGVGAFVGAVGGQILMVPAQHCTYADDAPRAQFRIGLVITALSALILLVPAWTLMRSGGIKRRARSSGYFHNLSLPYLFLLPTAVVLIVFLYFPGVQIMLSSLKRKIFMLPNEQFVCLDNYVSLADDTVYRNSFTTTFVLTTLIVAISLLIALAVATLAAQKVKYAGFYRTLLIWPYAISPVVTGVIFRSLFREGTTGLLNWGLDSTFGVTGHWLTDRYLAPAVIVAAAVWNLMGFNILFYIAGLQNVPQDLLEAASLDGANRFKRFWRITFPLLSPFTFFLLITNITYCFYGIYGVVEILTPQGGPRFGPGGESGATEMLIFKLYQDALETGTQAGFGAAQAVVLFLMVAGLTVFQFRIIERRVTYEG